jgi:hypothetical protein
MNLIPSLSVRAMVTLSVAAFIAFAVTAQSATKRQARVSALAGTVTYAKGGSGDFRPVAVGDVLQEGDVIKTGAGSHVDIDLGNNVGIIQLTPSSTLALRTLTIDNGADVVTETDSELRQGALYFKVNKLAKASRFEIATPKGVAGIRGTAGYLTSEGQLTISEGLAGMAFSPTEVVIVKAGEMVSATDRQPRPAPGIVLREIVESLRDALTHGIGRDIRPFVPPVEPFISPVLPPE